MINITFVLQLIFFSSFVDANTKNAPVEVRLATEMMKSLHKKGLPYIECVFAKMKRTYKVISVPWQRAQLGVEKSSYDGFFVASRNENRDHYAEFSEPFFNIDWLYIATKKSGLTPDDPNFTQKTFAANRGSARLTWLLDKVENQEITNEVIITTNSFSSVQMLSRGRVDINLENRENFEVALKKTGLPRSDFKTFIAKSKPVGVYFGNAFLNREPEFLESFNAGVRVCKEGQLIEP